MSYGSGLHYLVNMLQPQQLIFPGVADNLARLTKDAQNEEDRNHSGQPYKNERFIALVSHLNELFRSVNCDHDLMKRYEKK